MSRIDTPAHFEHYIDRIIVRLLRIKNDYRPVHGYAFGSPGSSRAGEGRNPRKPDPTGNAVANPRLQLARDDIRSVVADVDAADEASGKAEKTLRRYDYHRRDLDTLYEPGFQVVSKAEVAAAKEAQALRRKRLEEELKRGDFTHSWEER